MIPVLYDPDTRILHSRKTRCDLVYAMEWDLTTASRDSTELCQCLMEDAAVPDEELERWAWHG